MSSPFFDHPADCNRIHLLDRALQSVVAQQEPSWELLAADDGSVDVTWTSSCDWVREDHRIRCWRHGNHGQATRRKVMLQQARGDWVVFLDSDDEFLYAHLTLRREVIEADAAAGGVGLAHAHRQAPWFHVWSIMTS